MSLEAKLYHLFEEPEKSRASFVLNIGIYILIILSILNLMLYSVDSIRDSYGFVLDTIRNIVMPIFVLEYLCRLIASGYLNEYRGIRGKLRYMLTPYAIIDLLAILPYLLLNAGFNSSFIRSLRLLRIFRLFRIKKYSIFMKLMKEILYDLKEELLVLLFFTVIILVMLAFIIFDIEHEAQPEVFTNIFQTLWWSVATLTTVGYGDMYPITPAGKLITGIISILGIAFIAIPGGMFASKFTEAITEYKELQRDDEGRCCHCGSRRVEELPEARLTVGNGEEPLTDFKRCCDCGFVFAPPKEKKCNG